MTKIHHWKYNGDYTDSGSGLYTTTGTASNISLVDGVFDQGIENDNVSGYVDFGNLTDLQFTSGDFTFSDWIYVVTNTGTTQIIWSKFNVSGSRSYYLGYFINETFRFIISSSGSAVITALTSPIVPSGLYNVVIRKTGSQYDMFINGVNVVSNVVDGSIFNSTATFRVHNTNTSTLGFLDGWTDNLEIWDEALSSEEINNIYYSPAVLLGPGLPYLKNQDPAPDDTDVSTTTVVDFDITDDIRNISLSTVEVTIKGQLAYDGDAGGYQSPFTGDTPVDDGTGRGWAFRNITRSGGYFEDYDILIEIYAENNAGTPLDTSYEFEIEQVGMVPNSGFEAPGVSALIAKRWIIEGTNTVGTEGTDWGRLDKPSKWATPPEGDFVVGFGSNLLTSFSDPYFCRCFVTTADLTGAGFIEFTVKDVIGAVVPAGDTWTAYVIIGTTIEWSKVWDSDDGGDVTEETIQVEISGYTGINVLRSLVVFETTGKQIFVYELATSATFDGDTENKESFDLW